MIATTTRAEMCDVPMSCQSPALGRRATVVLAMPAPRCERVEGVENVRGAPQLVTFAAGELDEHAGVVPLH
jgi:hypothetical protein